MLTNVGLYGVTVSSVGVIIRIPGRDVKTYTLTKVRHASRYFRPASTSLGNLSNIAVVVVSSLLFTI